MNLLRETWLVFGRYMYLFVGNPVWVIIGVVQPVFYLVPFAPLLESIAGSRAFRQARTTSSRLAC